MTEIKAGKIEWYVCPHCGQKLFKLLPGAVVKGLLIKCKKCKEIVAVSL